MSNKLLLSKKNLEIYSLESIKFVKSYFLLNLNINFVDYFTSILLKSTFLVKISRDGNLRHLKSRPTIDR